MRDVGRSGGVQAVMMVSLQGGRCRVRAQLLFSFLFCFGPFFSPRLLTFSLRSGHRADIVAQICRAKPENHIH